LENVLIENGLKVLRPSYHRYTVVLSSLPQALLPSCPTPLYRP